MLVSGKLKYSCLSALIMTFLLCACETTDEPVPVRVIPDQLRPFVERFNSEAEKRGIQLDLSKLSFEFETGIPGGTDQNPVVGRCTKVENLHLITLDTITGLWQLSRKLGKEEIIFHELGHCLLDRGHKDYKFSTGDFSSIMRTVGLLQYGDLNKYTSLFKVPGDFNAHRREYYINELFNEATPPPCWSDSDITSPYPISFFVEDFIIDADYRDMWIDPNNNLWFYGGSMNYQFSEGTFQSRLPGVEISTMANDQHDNIWLAGQNADGVIIGTYEDRTLEIKFNKQLLPASMSRVDQLFVDRNNILWISDRVGELYVYAPGGFEHVPLPEGRITSIKKGPGSTVYLLKGGMLYVFQTPNNFVRLDDSNSELPTSFFRNMVVDGDGVAWLQMSPSVPSILRFKPDFRVEQLDFFDINLAETRINRLTTDLNGSLWIATSNGIKKWEGNSFSGYCTYNTAVPMLSFTSVAAAKNGDVWSLGLDPESSKPLLMLSKTSN